MPFLRQSTSQVIRFGPMLDKDDGVTEETALTLAQADMRLSKDGGAYAQKNASGNATHDSDGHYSTTLNATDTDTVGELRLNVHQPANTLPIWDRWWVLEEAIYDALFGAAADAFAANGSLRAVGSGGITSFSFAAQAIGSPALHVSTGEFIRAIANKHDLTASATGTTTTLIDSSVTDADDYWNGDWLSFTTPAGNAGLVRRITDWDLASNTFTFTPAIPLAPVSGNLYDIMPRAEVDVGTWLGVLVSALINGRVPAEVASRYKKNTATANIMFLMRDDVDHVTPEAGHSPTGTRYIDAAAPAAVTGTIAEISEGLYQFDASAADMDGDDIVFRFVASGVDDTFIAIRTSA